MQFTVSVFLFLISSVIVEESPFNLSDIALHYCVKFALVELHVA